MKRFKYAVLLVVLVLCNISYADNKSQSFSLESPLSGKIYGPFILQNNFVAEVESEKFLINISPNGFLQLKNIDKNTSTTPYEFTQGRMIRIDESLFTIIDVKDVPYVKPLPAPKPKPAPKPVTKPAVATTAVAGTKKVNTSNPKPAYKPESAMWTTRAKQAKKTTTKPKVQVKPKETVKPTSDASTYFTTSKYKPKPKKTTKKSPYQVPSSTVPYKPKSSSKSKLRPHKDVAFSDRLGISVDVSALETVNYDFSISGVEGSTDADISRNSLGIKLKVMPFVLELGKVMRADWGGQMNTPNLPFDNLDLGNGSGWWWDLGYSYPVWDNSGWLLAATANGSYRKEDYDLTYGVWTDSSMLVPSGTNGEVVIEATKELASTTEKAIFTEKMFKLGFDASYKADAWKCWAAVDFIAYHSAIINSDIDTPEGSYTIDVERTSPFIFTLGASIEKAGVNWFSTINIVGESAIRVGANYKF